MPAWTIRIEPSDSGDPRVIVEAQDAESEREAKLTYLKLRSEALKDRAADQIIVRMVMLNGVMTDGYYLLSELADAFTQSNIALNEADGRI